MLEAQGSRHYVGGARLGGEINSDKLVALSE